MNYKFDFLIDKLNSRLGEQAVSNLVMQAEHVPEMANQANAIEPDSLTQPQSARDQVEQPIWLLATAQRLASSNGRPSYQGPLQLIHGPHRIASHWWVTPHSRDYYIARQHSGRLLWIYFERIQQRWYWHGAFA